MGTFRCKKCGALVDLLHVRDHVCGAPGPRGGYADRPDGKSEMDDPEIREWRLSYDRKNRR
jgi:hypothetical protein